jgi:WLM domain
MDNNWLILVVLAVGVGYLLFDTYWSGDVEYVESRVDGHKYLVRSLPDKQEAADLLANIRANLERLVAHLEKAHPDDERTKMIVVNFRSDKIREGADNHKYTSYSINKGEQIVFCLRSRDGKDTLVDVNTMVFVAIHELAHIGTTDVGHTDTFWANMRWLLEVAMDIGIYTKQDFESKPVRYCGVDIKTNLVK